MTTARSHTPSKSLDDLATLRRTFSVEVARAIVDRVGLPVLLDPDDHNPEVEADPDDMMFAQLARRLNDASLHWGLNERRQTSATPAKRAVLADRVAAKCAGLVALMRGEDGDLLDSLGARGLWAQAKTQGADSGRDAVAAALKAVDDLQGWALGMAERDKRDTRGKSGNEPNRRPDEAFNTLLAELGDVFSLFWRRAPALSRPDQVIPGGPFFRFVAAVMDELDMPKTDEALASAISDSPALRRRRSLMRGEWQ